MNKVPAVCCSLKLPFTFETMLLNRDLELCLADEWSRHFNTQDYSGDWTSISLYSASGKTTDIFTAASAQFIATPLAGKCIYFNEIITSMQSEKESVRLLHLAPGSSIHEHRDRGLAYEYNTFRLHIPVLTSADVDFIVGGEQLTMQAGECWYANFNLPHSVNNRSNASRIHLVIDCKRNAWTDELFGKAGYDFDAEHKALQPDRETLLQMIAELERLNTETSHALATDLKSKLNG